MLNWTRGANKSACVEGSAKIPNIFEVVPVHCVIMPLVTSIGERANRLDLQDRGAAVGALCLSVRAAVQVARHHRLLLFLVDRTVDRRELGLVLTSTAHEARTSAEAFLPHWSGVRRLRRISETGVLLTTSGSGCGGRLTLFRIVLVQHGGTVRSQGAVFIRLRIVHQI